MPMHAQPRQALISRPGTVLALSLVVSTLAVVALVQSPGRAMADEPSVLIATAIPPAANSARPTFSLVDLEDARLARLAEQDSQREAQRERADARQRREAREQRQERRAAARAKRAAPHWVMPVPGAGWSASFGEAGSYWSSGYHTGQDFTASEGTPVLAVGAGTITSASWSDAYGNIIEITHPNGDQSWYAHMSSFERTSGSIRTGDVIGYVGCTGNCFGDHLHFEYHPGGGEAADPLPWLHRNGAY